MKRRGVAIVIALLAAGAAHAQRVSQLSVSVPGYQRAVLLDTVVVWTEVEAPLPATYTAVRQSLQSLDVPITVVDSAHYFFYNPSIKASRRFLGQPMTWAMHCGADVTGVDLAQSARVTMALAVLVDSLPNGHSRIGVALAGGAQTVDGTSRPPLPCSTTGAVEQKILDDTGLHVIKR
ncbi:MAG TPA: hypothetical protein VJ867_05000 [Gemmatimonadaceae bacterium]|nr:hypothetical protein [Gemmatimonadaceae bacterium]